jgi:hypothetical protein
MSLCKNRGWTQVVQKGKNIPLYLWHQSYYLCKTRREGRNWYYKCSTTVHKVMTVTLKLSTGNYNVTNRNPWFSSLLVNSSPLSRKSWWLRNIVLRKRDINSIYRCFWNVVIFKQNVPIEKIEMISIVIKIRSQPIPNCLVYVYVYVNVWRSLRCMCGKVPEWLEVRLLNNVVMIFKYWGHSKM